MACRACFAGAHASIGTRGLAALGVGHALLQAGGMSWETWLVALRYPVYFLLRRRLRTDHLAGHWLDMVLLLPTATWFVLRARHGLRDFLHQRERRQVQP